MKQEKPSIGSNPGPKPGRERLFPTAKEDAESAQLPADSPQTQSSSYRLAFQDSEFLLRDELRPVRLQLELLKPELIQQEHQIESTVVIFGSARIPDPETAKRNLEVLEKSLKEASENENLLRLTRIARRAVENSRYYEDARKLGALISRNTDWDKLVVVTGGGPGIMEAANRGAFESGAQSIGMNIVLPYEQRPNPYITPDLSFNFHYFAIRKMHLLIRAKAMVAFPGGFGTLDELFETLTLIQGGKVKKIPVLLFGKNYWDKVVNFDALLEEGMIGESDFRLFRFVETAEEAWEVIAKANGL
ncbi:MAG: TIGR00730 family Rossman fold protein [Desulfobacteraceae bacterium]|nr:MAG: TIGR00730 family Rossman fold protein [Desulfobacteraceae bacterium]